MTQAPDQDVAPDEALDEVQEPVLDLDKLMGFQVRVDRNAMLLKEETNMKLSLVFAGVVTHNAQGGPRGGCEDLSNSSTARSCAVDLLGARFSFRSRARTKTRKTQRRKNMKRRIFGERRR